MRKKFCLIRRLANREFPFIICLFFLSFKTSGQTNSDTLKTGKANDAMIVNPGKGNDGMAVKPSKPNDGMSVLSDTAFVAKNIDDNRMEIELSKLGQQKGTSIAVKKIAATMVTDHTAILNDLEKLSVKKRATAGAFQKEMAMQQPTLPEGKDFDKVWASQMLTMHNAKIAELETFIGLTKDATLKAAVMKAIPKLKAHREMLLKIPGAKENAGAMQTI